MSHALAKDYDEGGCQHTCQKVGTTTCTIAARQALLAFFKGPSFTLITVNNVKFGQFWHIYRYVTFMMMKQC